MQPTTTQDTGTRLPSGPTALIAVLAIVIVALAAGLAAVLVTGPGAGAMP